MVKVGPKATILAHPMSLIVVALARGVNIGLTDHLHVRPLVIRSGVLKRRMHAEGYWGVSSGGGGAEEELALDLPLTTFPLLFGLLPSLRCLVRRSPSISLREIGM
jgi:hypothetical protein